MYFVYMYCVYVVVCCQWRNKRRWYLGDGATDRREILHDGTHRYRTLFLVEQCVVVTLAWTTGNQPGVIKLFSPPAVVTCPTDLYTHNLFSLLTVRLRLHTITVVLRTTATRISYDRRLGLSVSVCLSHIGIKLKRINVKSRGFRC